jgi:hypothetical protein
MFFSPWLLFQPSGFGFSNRVLTRQCRKSALGTEVFAVFLNRLASVHESVPSAVFAGLLGLLNVLALPSELETLASASPVVLDCALWRRPIRDCMGSAGSLNMGLKLLGGLAVEVDLNIEVCHWMALSILLTIHSIKISF